MKTILTMAAAFMLSISANATVDPGDGVKSELETITVTMTFAELKEIYGADSFVIEGAESISDESLINFTTIVGGPPCDGLIPCGALLAQQRHIAQQLANECCCVQFGGGICCDQGNTVNILFVVNPTNCR